MYGNGVKYCLLCPCCILYSHPIVSCNISSQQLTMIGLKSAALMFGLATLLTAVLVKAEATVAGSDENAQYGVRGLAPKPKVKVCHISPGPPTKFQTIEISESALKAHLAHGDRRGPCNSHCDFLCSDNNVCTIDYNGVCEKNGCIPVANRQLTPACRPTSSPSKPPSKSPSASPSSKPTPTSSPSKAPSKSPSASPSLKPTPPQPGPAPEPE